MATEKHFILTLGRSGSNTLVDALNQNPAILNFGEVLGDWMPVRKAQRRLGIFKNDNASYMDAILSNPVLQRSACLVRNFEKRRRGKKNEIKRFARIKTIGVKEFSLNMLRYDLVSYLQDRPSIKVIGLIRRNPIDRMISSLRLDATGVVSAEKQTSVNVKNTPENQKLHLDISDIISKLEIIEAENLALLEMLNALAKNNVLTINYSDFYSTSERTMEILSSAQSFLGVPPYTPKIRMGKIIQSDPLEILNNYEEARKIISNSKFSEFLYAK